MKRGSKIILIILGIIALLLGTFFLVKYQYTVKIGKGTESVFNGIEYYNQADWENACGGEEGIVEAVCLLGGYYQLIYRNETITESYCEEMSPEKILLIEKILFPENTKDLKVDIAKIRNDCLFYVKTN